MTAADRPRAILDKVADKALEAAGNGSAAIQEGESAVATLTASIGHLRNSRVHSLQELENLVSIITLLGQVFGDDPSLKVNAIMTQFTTSRDGVEAYSNEISEVTRDLESYLTTVLEKLANLSRTGRPFLDGARNLAEYSQNL